MKSRLVSLLTCGATLFANISIAGEDSLNWREVQPWNQPISEYAGMSQEEIEKSGQRKAKEIGRDYLQDKGKEIVKEIPIIGKIESWMKDVRDKYLTWGLGEVKTDLGEEFKKETFERAKDEKERRYVVARVEGSGLSMRAANSKMIGISAELGTGGIYLEGDPRGLYKKWGLTIFKNLRFYVEGEVEPSPIKSDFGKSGFEAGAHLKFKW